MSKVTTLVVRILTPSWVTSNDGCIKMAFEPLFIEACVETHIFRVSQGFNKRRICRASSLLTNPKRWIWMLSTSASLELVKPATETWKDEEAEMDLRVGHFVHSFN